MGAETNMCVQSAILSQETQLILQCSHGGLWLPSMDQLVPCGSKCHNIFLFLSHLSSLAGPSLGGTWVPASVCDSMHFQQHQPGTLQDTSSSGKIWE